MSRNMFDHDYYGVCSYMVTLRKSELLPLLSSLTGNVNKLGERIDAVPTDLGNIVVKACELFVARNPKVKVHYKVIMPDHAHIIFKVVERLSFSFKWHLARFKQTCTTLLWDMYPEYRHKDIPLFVRDADNHKIMFSETQMRRWEFYISDNPRRALMRRTLKECFHRDMIVDRFGNGWNVYGNKNLLVYPEKVVVRFTSKRTMSENVEYLDWCRKMASVGAVLVSPFIHAEERRVYKDGMQNGWRMIRVVECPFGPRANPAKTEFNYCATGNLLFFSLKQEVPVSLRKGPLPRDVCKELNLLAERIARSSFRL
jgi:REP element-mobilizing transposase RayT